MVWADFVIFQDVLLPVHHRGVQVLPSRAQPNPPLLLRPSHSSSTWHKWVFHLWKMTLTCCVGVHCGYCSHKPEMCREGVCLSDQPFLHWYSSLNWIRESCFLQCSVPGIDCRVADTVFAPKRNNTESQFSIFASFRTSMFLLNSFTGEIPDSNNRWRYLSWKSNLLIRF